MSKQGKQREEHSSLSGLCSHFTAHFISGHLSHLTVLEEIYFSLVVSLSTETVAQGTDLISESVNLLSRVKILHTLQNHSVSAKVSVI